jgi:hypothetical protein
MSLWTTLTSPHLWQDSGEHYSAQRPRSSARVYNARKNAELSERDARENAELSEGERSQDAYDRARRALLRVRNRRKRMRVRGERELEQMELQLYLADLFDAQHGCRWSWSPAERSRRRR